ncbi:von Willebrand factor A domain-containing protein 5A-like, partial [Lates japonicus]
SSFTAFIAVNKGNNEPIQGPLVRRDVPIPMMGIRYGRRMHRSLPAFDASMGLLQGSPAGVSFFAIQSHIGAVHGFGTPVSLGLTCNIKKSAMKRPPAAPLLHDGPASVNYSNAGETEGTMIKQPSRDPLLQLVSLQKASGCWVLDPALAAALGKTSDEVEKPKPASVGYCQK